MGTITISQLSLLIAWFGFAVLMFILALIARFYEKFSKQTTYFRLYAAPVLIMGAATARYVSLDQWGGDLVGDILMAFGGMFLLTLCYHLYHQMTRGTRSK